MVHRSQYQYAIDVTILSSLLLLTLLVNIIIIVSVTLSKRLNNIVPNIYLAELAFFEVIYGVFVILPETLQYYMQGSSNLISNNCEALSWVRTFLDDVITSLLVVLIHDRYVLVTRPLAYINKVGEARIRLTCVSLATIILPLVYTIGFYAVWTFSLDLGEYEFRDDIYMCGFQSKNDTVKQQLIVKLTDQMVELALFLLLTFMNVVLIVKLRGLKLSGRRLSNKHAKMVVWLTTAHLFSKIPSFVADIIHETLSHVPRPYIDFGLYKYWYWFPYISVAMHPLIFLWHNSLVTAQIKKLFVELNHMMCRFRPRWCRSFASSSESQRSSVVSRKDYGLSLSSRLASPDKGRKMSNTTSVQEHIRGGHPTTGILLMDLIKWNNDSPNKDEQNDGTVDICSLTPEELLELTTQI